MPATPAAETAFGAIASETRRKLLDALAGRERSVGELVEVACVSQPAVSQHLKVLREAGLVEERRDGRFRYYRLDAAPLAEVMGWVRAYEQFWTGRLEALGRVLDGDAGRPELPEAHRPLGTSRRELGGRERPRSRGRRRGKGPDETGPRSRRHKGDT